MKKNNLLKLLGIAFVVAIVSTGIFYGLFVNKLSSNTGALTIVVAAKALTPGTVLQTGDVKTIPWSSPSLPKGTYQTAGQVAGNTVVEPIGADELVLAGHLANSASGGGADVPSGMRAISVHVTDSTGVLSLLRPGQKVDVQVVVGRGNSTADTSVRTALEDLRVLSVTPVPEQSSQGQSLPVVTLLAKPADADVLALADSGARVRLSLRNPLDNETRARGPLSLGAIMHTGGQQ